MYAGAALSFGLIRVCRSGLVLYCSVLSDAGGQNDGSSAIFEISLLYDKLAISNTYSHAKNLKDLGPITLPKVSLPEVGFSAVAILGGGWLQSPASDGPPWGQDCRRCHLTHRFQEMVPIATLRDVALLRKFCMPGLYARTVQVWSTNTWLDKDVTYCEI